MTTALATLQETPKSDLVRKVLAMRASVARHKEQAAHAAERMLDSVLTAGGGVGFALTEHYGPQKQVVPGFDNAAFIGIGLSVLGAMNMLGEASNAAAEVGNGMLAVEAYKQTLKHLK